MSRAVSRSRACAVSRTVKFVESFRYPRVPSPFKGDQRFRFGAIRREGDEHVACRCRRRILTSPHLRQRSGCRVPLRSILSQEREMWRWGLGVAIVSGLAPATVPVHLVRLVRGKWLCKHDVRLNVSFANGDWAAAWDGMFSDYRFGVAAALLKDPEAGGYMGHLTDVEEEVMVYSLKEEKRIPSRGDRGWLVQLRSGGADAERPL